MQNALMLLAFLSSLAQANVVRNYRSSSCHISGKCLKITALRADVSSLGDLTSFKDVQIEILNQKTGKVTRFQAKRGLQDFETKTLVLEEVKNGQSVSYDLESLEPI